MNTFSFLFSCAQFGFASGGRAHKGRSAGRTRYVALRPHADAALGIALLQFSATAIAQEIPADSTQTALPLDEVLISAVRANEKTPVTFTNLSKKEIAKRNLGQDIPILMNFMPSVVTTSDAGAGVGYTG